MITSGSYGGTYVPHIATVIHEQNQALASGKGQPGAVHINLESLIISNPFSVSGAFMTTVPRIFHTVYTMMIHHNHPTYVGSKLPLPLVAAPRLPQHATIQQHHLRGDVRAPAAMHGAHPIRV